MVRKKAPELFFADVGHDLELDTGQTAVLSAALIDETATYHWYDAGGTLVHTDRDLAVSGQHPQKYKLEVTATADGFKDYDEVWVRLKPNGIESISPNPSTAQALIKYTTNNTTNAYLMVTDFYGTNAVANNYPLDTSLREISLNFSQYPTGLYTVALICDGQLTDAKTLAKQ